ncbi:hypothetical protein JCM9279_007101 [Rhodotorula babjevae]
MLAHILALPSAAVSGTANYLNNRRRGLAYTAGALGGAYVLGQWAVQRVLEGAEKGRKENGERDDLSRRFSLNLQDSQFTVLALVPTIASQLQQELDVEARSTALSDLARRDKERRADEARRAQEAAAAEAVAQQEKEYREAEAARAVEARELNGGEAADDAAAGDPEEPSVNGYDADSPTPSPAPADSSAPPAHGIDPAPDAPTPAPDATPSLSSPLLPSTSLNPSAAPFQPRSTSPPSDLASTAVTFGEADGASSVLGKSWAEIVKTSPPAPEAPVVEPTAAASGASAEVIGVEIEGVEVDGAHEPAAPSQANGEAVGVDTATAQEAAEPATDAPSAPEKSKVELWSEIKLLSFTRLITSLYVLVLLSLQTHVQLALLGRASYVDSLVSTLPPRTPSPRSAAPLPLPGSTALLSDKLLDSPSDDHDLERALYEAKRLPPTADERREEKERERKDLERKYLTFSWWLLHEGWKVVRERVEQAVEAVVGPMSLKAPLVYGELGAMLGEIRRRIELDAATGKPFDFSSANHPPTSALEIQTLVSGGSYVPSPPSSSSSSSSFPPSSRRTRPDPITPSLRSLLNETNDALDSPDGALVRALSLDRLFALVVERLEPAFSAPSAAAGAQADERGARFEDVTEKQARLASLLPLVTRLSSADGGVLSSGVNSNDFVEALEEVRELREFSAVLYGSWDRDNIDASCVL